MNETPKGNVTAEEWRDQAEAVHIAKAEARRAQLTAVRDALPGLEADADEAMIEHRAVVSRASNWDSPMPKAGERTKASERAENLRDRLAGAKAAEARLAAQQMPTDARVAQAVADALGALYGVEAIGTVAPVKLNAAIEAPAILVQAVETESRDDGMFTGVVEVYLFRTPIYRPLDGRRIIEALRRADIGHNFTEATTNLGIRTLATGKGREVDRVRLRVGPLAAGPCVIRNVSPNVPDVIARLFHIEVAAELGLALVAGGQDGSFVYHLRERTLAGVVSSAELISEDISGNQREATVKIRLYLEAHGAPLALIHAAAERVNQEWTTSVIAGFGDVTAAAVSGEIDQPTTGSIYGQIHRSDAWRKADLPPAEQHPGFEPVTCLVLEVTARSITRGD